jgi:ribulose-phosphate 3-epimerase
MGWTDWMREVEVEPSLYAANFAILGEQVDTLLHAGTRIFHFDVGDGHFVPPVTMGPIVLQSISGRIHDAGAFVDCHLMTETPEKYFDAMAAAGGDSVTVHFEASPDLGAVVRAARARSLQIGLAFKPETAPRDAVRAASDTGVDLVLCMSIEPGYSGQEFMKDAYDRIRETRQLLPAAIPVQVDGGIERGNIPAVRDAGARLFVSGTSTFDADDIAAAYRGLVEALR